MLLFSSARWALTSVDAEGHGALSSSTSVLFNSLWHYLELKEETGTPDPPFSEEVGATESSELPALSGTAALARCPLTQTCPGPLRSRPPSWIDLCCKHLFSCCFVRRSCPPAFLGRLRRLRAAGTTALRRPVPAPRVIAAQHLPCSSQSPG